MRGMPLARGKGCTRGGVISRRRTGQFVGEVSLLEGRGRRAIWATAARAVGPVKALVLQRDDLRSLLRRRPDAEAPLRAGVPVQSFGHRCMSLGEVTCWKRDVYHRSGTVAVVLQSRVCGEANVNDCALDVIARRGHIAAAGKAQNGRIKGSCPCCFIGTELLLGLSAAMAQRKAEILQLEALELLAGLQAALAHALALFSGPEGLDARS